MLHIRTTKTASGATAVQVVEYVQRKMIILTHIGSAKSDEQLLSYQQLAANWIVDHNSQMSLFGHLPISASKSNSKSDEQREALASNLESDLVDWSNYRAFGVRHQLLYDVLKHIITDFRFDLLNFGQIKMLIDLIIARIIAPSSKLEALQFLEESFGIKYQYRTLSRSLSSFALLKDDAEAKVINIAKKHFGFNFSLVFYDLTTLYFESFESDDLCKIGFSKDNKTNQPQIMIGLLVNDQGFPISYQVFEGNKFEGHTLMPSILAIKKKYKIDEMTVVADSAMISDENVLFLKASNLNYIVGARVANLGVQMIEKISKELNQIDDATIRINTPKGKLICHFASNRYRKDKIEMEKQINKAKGLINNSSDPNPARKRTKFLKHKDNDKNNYELNHQLIHKTNLLLGIKGYYTNLGSNLDDNITDQEIIKQYRNLWHVEQAFRISKSDLKMRPIFHFKQHSIKAHLLICFMALAICKFIEIKTGRSIKAVVKLLKTAINTVIINKSTGETITLESEIGDEVMGVLGKLKCHTKMS